MSKKDQQLVKDLGVSLSRVASELDISRQAVSRGIKQDENYFNSNTLSILLNKWKETDTDLFQVATSSVRYIYKEDADKILASVRIKTPEYIDTAIPGEFVLVCSDLASFRNESKKCHEQVLQIIENIEDNGGILEFIYNKPDIKAVAFYEKLFETNTYFNKIPCTVNLDLFPTYLLRVGVNLDVDLFGCANDGFIGLSEFEVHRIRRTVENLKLPMMDIDA